VTPATATPARSTALDRALRIFEEHGDAGRRASSALRSVLAGVYHSEWPDVAWEFSSLTGDGFPVEFTFSTQNSDFRYTAEVAGPETASSDRLRRAIAFAGESGTEAYDFLKAVQRAGPLRYGAWIGGRHGASGDSFKIYVEAPMGYCESADSRIAELFGTRDLLAHRATPLKLIGYEPASQRYEFYFKTTALERWEVSLLLRNLGLAACDRDLYAFVGEVRGKAFGHRSLGTNTGFSIRRDVTDGRVAFSFLTYARSLWGGDCRIRKRLLELAPRLGWDATAYARISEPLVMRDDARTLHGIVAVTVTPMLPPSFQIGLRPPEANVDA
jgi:hypothetical protein